MVQLSHCPEGLNWVPFMHPRRINGYCGGEGRRAMRSRHVTEGRLILLAMIVLLMVTVGGSREAALSREDDWLGAMTRAVVGEQAKEGALWGTYAPYVAQLTVVRDHLLKDDTDGVYGAMNRLMDMFERREN